MVFRGWPSYGVHMYNIKTSSTCQYCQTLEDQVFDNNSSARGSLSSNRFLDSSKGKLNVIPAPFCIVLKVLSKKHTPKKIYPMSWLENLTLTDCKQGTGVYTNSSPTHTTQTAALIQKTKSYEKRHLLNSQSKLFWHKLTM